MTNPGSLYRLSAFSDRPDGGNPAGVWVGDALPDTDDMQRIAADVGYSETVFIAPAHGEARTARYYSPVAEVSFCGHATIAAGAMLAELGGDGVYRLATQVGEVPVAVRWIDGRPHATLTSVMPRHRIADAGLLDELLPLLGWRRDELDTGVAPALAYAGAWHFVIAAGSRERLDRLDYDFDAVRALMLREQLTTLQLVWREAPGLWHARNPFPVGGVVEDPATGAAAAAFGGYLRDAGLVGTPATLLIRQGEAMGRPSRLQVDIPVHGGIEVSGTAVRLDPSGNSVVAGATAVPAVAGSATQA